MVDALDDQRHTPFEQFAVEVLFEVGEPFHLGAEGKRAHSELLSVVCLDFERDFRLADVFAAGAECKFQRVLARSGLELVLVMIGRFEEPLHIILVVQI